MKQKNKIIGLIARGVRPIRQIKQTRTIVCRYSNKSLSVTSGGDL